MKDKEMKYFIISKCSSCGKIIEKEDFFWISESNLKETLSEISQMKVIVSQDHYCEKQEYYSIRGALVPVGIRVVKEIK
jgi:heterodisulfide reductase subunit B